MMHIHTVHTYMSLMIFCYNLVNPPVGEFQVHGKGEYTVRQVPEEELKHIRESNSLDIQLYSEAKTLFYKRLCDSGIACYGNSRSNSQA